MVYNKFKQGFLKNLFAYVVMVVFLTLTVLLVIFDDNPVRITASVICFGILLLFFIYDLFLSEVFIFKEAYFLTNKYPYNSPKYAPKLFKKSSVQYNTIMKIEKRSWDKRRFVLIIYFKEDEPLQYIFAHEDSRDFVYDKLLELKSCSKK